VDVGDELNSMQVVVSDDHVVPADDLVEIPWVEEPFPDLTDVVVVAAVPDPDFGVAAEPLTDGAFHVAVDGVPYYRPGLRVADRGPGLLAGPDVWFLKDNQGAIRLVWTLADVPPAAPDTAGPGATDAAGASAAGPGAAGAGAAAAKGRPLPVTVGAARLAWNGGGRTLDPPVVEAIGTRPGFLVRGVVPLRADEATALELVMADASSGCRLEVDCTFRYTTQVGDVTTMPRVMVIPDRHRHLAEELGKEGYSPQQLDVRGTTYWVVDTDVYPQPAYDLYEASPWAWLDRGSLGTIRAELVALLGEEEVAWMEEQTVTRPVPRTETVTRTVPFVFNPNDDPNRPIYRSLHGAANLTAEWRRSAAGWLRDSGFPNTVYRIPDELRLAFDPDMGTPHLVTTLHQDDTGRSSVRVLLRIAPWQDPRKILETRELVHSDAAEVIVGPVESATLRLGGSFPEAIRVLGESGQVVIALSEPTDLLLELSLEYFQLLCGMLGGAVGLSGEVEVTLGSAGPGSVVPVPVTLRMDKVDDLPVEVRAPTTASPTSARITNRAGTAIRIGGCAAVFLQTEAGSVVPLRTSPARCTSTFPIELAADGTADLTFEAAAASQPGEWNAVLVELLDKAMVDDARTLLLRANELAGSGELTWDVVIGTPIFDAMRREATDDRWATLTSVEVEVSAPGFDTTTVVLRADAASRTLTMRKPLVSLVTGGAAGIRTVTYRVRNNYVDHKGRWSAPEQQSGEELVVFPNPPDGD